jgi:hypothetical protein
VVGAAKLQLISAVAGPDGEIRWMWSPVHLQVPPLSEGSSDVNPAVDPAT